jgi:hypothetical protein
LSVAKAFVSQMPLEREPKTSNAKVGEDVVGGKGEFHVHTGDSRYPRSGFSDLGYSRILPNKVTVEVT